jgi:hypothetical protein
VFHHLGFFQERTIMPAFRFKGFGDSYHVSAAAIKWPRNNAVPSPFAVLMIAIVVLSAVGVHGQVSVLTQHNDVARTGQNLGETVLTPANVNAALFGKLYLEKVDGAIAGQPLYVPNVQLANGTMHNVVYVVTQHDSVYAFDADSNQGSNATPLWTVSLGKSVLNNTANYGCGGIAYTELGIMGTPVIDPTTKTLYAVAKSLTLGVYSFSLHALDITSGVEKFGGPTPIAATVQTTKGPITFTPSIQMQRPALLLLNGTVYIGFGSNGCDSFSYHGWLMAYSASTLKSVGTFITTPQGEGGAIWEAGGGPAADSEGFIYFPTGNGTFDFSSGGTDFGDSIIKLNTVKNGFGVKDYFTPFDQAMLDTSDLDLGSGGILILPDQGGLHKHELIGGGKEGTLYLVDRDDLGQYNTGTNNTVQFFPGITPSIKTTAAYWNGSVYLSGQKDNVKMFALNAGLLTGPTSASTGFFMDRGPSLSISANGNSNGIVWVLDHDFMILYALDATNLANELYDSTQALRLRDKLAPTSRFVTPTVANGKVYIGSISGLSVYGLLPALTATAGANQTGVARTVLSIPLSVQVADPYSDAPLAGVTVTCKDGGAGGIFSSAVNVTPASGLITMNYTLPVKVKNLTITCTAPGSTSALFPETVVAGPPHIVRVFTGSKQTAPVKTQLPQPLVVTVLDTSSNPLPGITVAFSDGGKGGSFSSVSATTDGSGHASTMYTTGSVSGIVHVSAAVTGLASASFTVTVTAQ